jgi:integrase
MAWLYKRGETWWVGYRHNGTQVLRSTKKTSEAEAKKELEKIEMLFGASRAGSLTEELYQALTGSTLPKITLAAEIEDWLSECRATTAEKTVLRYDSFAKEFKRALNVTVKAPLLADVTTEDIRRFLNAKRSETAASTANLARKTISAIFIRAVKNHHLRQNPVSPIKPFKALKGEKVSKRAYSLKELGEVHAKAPDDFWRYMILGEFYTGLRMGDLICLRWDAVDLPKAALRLKDDKTEKPMLIPLAKSLLAVLVKLHAAAGKVKPSDFLWPEQAARYQERGSGPFSSEFYKKILTPCGLVTARPDTHEATGKGHGGKRQVNELSFHSLRHSFVSFLRSTGSNQSVAKELAGHSSDSVNDLYTHNPEELLVTAINQLPEFAK